MSRADIVDTIIGFATEVRAVRSMESLRRLGRTSSVPSPSVAATVAPPPIVPSSCQVTARVVINDAARASAGVRRGVKPWAASNRRAMA